MTAVKPKAGEKCSTGFRCSSAHLQLRPVRYATVILARTALRTAGPRCAVVAIRLVRARVQRLVRGLAHVPSGFTHAVRDLVRRLLRMVAHVAGRVRDVLASGLGGSLD